MSTSQRSERILRAVQAGPEQVPGGDMSRTSPNATFSDLGLNDVEARICGIFQQLLSLSSVGVDQNYFELGGNSMLAVRLFAMLKAEYGVQLRLETIFTAATPRQLAKVVARASDQASVRGAAVSALDADSGPHRGLHLLKKGADGSLPLFLIHGDQANGLLARHLPPEQELWGYAHQGSDGERIRLTTVEALADRCHEEWLDQVGTGPCVVAGHSFGGLVAYHVAVLRQRQGLATPRLILLDTRHPSAYLPDGRGLGWAALRGRYVSYRGRAQFRASLREAKSILDRGGIIPPEKRKSYILGVYDEATVNYRPPYWTGALEIIRCREERETPIEDQWERSALGSVRRVVVPGNHLSIVRTRHGIAQIAESLVEILADVRSHGEHRGNGSADTVKAAGAKRPLREVEVSIVARGATPLAPALLASIAREREDVAKLGIDLRARIVVSSVGEGERLAREVAESGWGDWIAIIRAPADDGVARGSNLCFRAAFDAGKARRRLPDYFFLLSPDAEVMPGAVATLVAFLDSHRTAGVAASSLEGPDGTRRPSAFRFPNLLGELDRGAGWATVSKLLRRPDGARPMGAEPDRVDWMPTMAMMIRRELIEQAGGLDECYRAHFAEVDFCRKAHRAGWERWYVPQSHVRRLTDEGEPESARSRPQLRLPDDWYESRQRYLLKNHSAHYAVASDLALLAASLAGELKDAMSGHQPGGTPYRIRDIVRHSALFRVNRARLPAEEYRPDPLLSFMELGELES